MASTELGILIYKPFIYEEKNYIYIPPTVPSFHRVLWESREVNHSAVATLSLFYKIKSNYQNEGFGL